MPVVSFPFHALKPPTNFCDPPKIFPHMSLGEQNCPWLRITSLDNTWETRITLHCEKVKLTNIKNWWQLPIFDSLILKHLLQMSSLGIDFEIGIQEVYQGVCTGTISVRDEESKNGKRKKLNWDTIETESYGIEWLWGVISIEAKGHCHLQLTGHCTFC